MSHKNLSATICTILMLSVFGSTGCFRPTMGPMIPIPIPVSPYFQDHHEDKAWEHERYERVPILGPITAGGPAIALDPPSDDEIIGRAGKGASSRRWRSDAVRSSAQ